MLHCTACETDSWTSLRQMEATVSKVLCKIAADLQPTLQDSIRRSGVVPVSGSVPSVGMGWMIVLTGMAIPMAGMASE